MNKTHSTNASTKVTRKSSKKSLARSAGENRQNQQKAEPGCTLQGRNLHSPNYDTSTWMSDLYRENPQVKLNQIVIPGSHDSATDQMTRKSAYAKFNKLLKIGRGRVCMWAKTQHHTIYDQLMDGIRYLDLRLENTDTGWKTFHGLVSNCFVTVLNEIGQYANNHPREIIIVDFQHLVDFQLDDHIKLMKFIDKHPTLGSRLAGNHLGMDGTLLDYWNADKNVIILYSEGHRHFSHLYWNRKQSIDSPWYNTPKKSVLQEKLNEGIIHRDVDKLYVSQLILTPDVLKVVSGFMFGVSSLYALTVAHIPDLIANGLVQRLDLSAKSSHRHLNIVIVDFYEHSLFVEQCLNVNSRNLQCDS